MANVRSKVTPIEDNGVVSVPRAAPITDTELVLRRACGGAIYIENEEPRIRFTGRSIDSHRAKGMKGNEHTSGTPLVTRISLVLHKLCADGRARGHRVRRLLWIGGRIHKGHTTKSRRLKYPCPWTWARINAGMDRARARGQGSTVRDPQREGRDTFRVFPFRRFIKSEKIASWDAVDSHRSVLSCDVA